MEPTPELNKALALAQASMPDIPKSRTANAGKYSYNYADISDVLKACLPVLAKHGLSVTQRTSLDPNGSPVLVTELRHSSGESVESRIVVHDNGDDQKLGSSLTYRRRYALCGLIGVAPADDDDGQISGASRPQSGGQGSRQLQANSYPGTCVRCKETVEAKSGFFKKGPDGKPLTIHKGCLAEQNGGSPPDEVRGQATLEDVQGKWSKCAGCGEPMTVDEHACTKCGLVVGEELQGAPS